MSILQEAQEIIYGERTKTYGKASISFNQAAGILTQLTGKEFTYRDILLTQMILKLIRNENSPGNKDHILDCIGYAAMLSDIQSEELCDK